MKIQSLIVMAAVGVGIVSSSGCGESTPPAAPTPVAVATPAPSPTPVATDPSHTPAPPPCPTCEAPVSNTAPPVRLTIRLYKVEDAEGRLVDGIPSSIPVGYKVTIDATPKDEDNVDTLGSGTVDFTFSEPDLVKISGQHGFQKKMTVLAPGVIDVQAFLDGVESNILTVTLG